MKKFLVFLFVFNILCLTPYTHSEVKVKNVVGAVLGFWGSAVGLYGLLNQDKKHAHCDGSVCITKKSNRGFSILACALGLPILLYNINQLAK